MVDKVLKRLKWAGDASLQTLALSALWLLHRRNTPARSGTGKEYIERYLSNEMKRLDREFKERRGWLDEAENNKRCADGLREVLEAVEAMRVVEARRGFNKAVRRFAEEEPRGKV